MTPLDAVSVAKLTLLVICPEVLMLLVATAMMTAGAFVRLPRRVWAWATFGTFVAALASLIALRHTTVDVYSAVAINDAFSGYVRLGLLLAGLVLLGLAHDQVDDARAPEFFGSLLMVHAGAMLVGAANDLIFLFLSLELVSIPTYLLLYLPRRNATTQEAATKYFFLSVFSSALLLFGLAYFYGLTGVSNLKAVAYLVHWKDNVLGAQGYPQVQMSLIALVFIMAGLGFRVAAVPFHWYAPDVYEGSPTVIAALLAWVPKVVGFVAILRVLVPVFGTTVGSEPTLTGLGIVSDKAALLAGLIAVATMTLGNTVALRQDNLRRLLAYSSIAHAGYLMVGVAAAFRNAPVFEGEPALLPNGAGHLAGFLGGSGVVLYLATYALMTLGAFGVMIALSTPDRPIETIEDLSGLAWTHPWPALAMGLCLFSLAGVPPMAGFYGKFWIFGAALEAAHGPDTRSFQALAIIGVLNAAIGAYYYLRILMKMTLSPRPDRPLTPRASLPAMIAVGACASLSLALGIATGPLANASRSSAVAGLTLPQAVPEPVQDEAGVGAARTADARSVAPR